MIPSLKRRKAASQYNIDNEGAAHLADMTRDKDTMAELEKVFKSLRFEIDAIMFTSALRADSTVIPGVKTIVHKFTKQAAGKLPALAAKLELDAVMIDRGLDTFRNMQEDDLASLSSLVGRGTWSDLRDLLRMKEAREMEGIGANLEKELNDLLAPVYRKLMDVA